MTTRHFLIQCSDPTTFDKTINNMGAVLMQENITTGQYMKKDGHYVMVVFGNADFIKFAIEKQGYGKIIKEFTEEEIEQIKCQNKH